MTKHIDETGNKYGRLTLLERVPNLYKYAVRYRARCECGSIGDYILGKLKFGHTSSCGCLKAETTKTYNLGRHEFTGKRFGRLLVVERVFPNGRMRWRCVCDCGKEKLATTIYLKTSDVPSCGCAAAEAASSRRFVDLSGTRFGKLVAKSHAGFNTHGKALWQCACDCGAVYLTLSASLRTGRTVSCGCARSDENVYSPAVELAKSAVRGARRRARKLSAGGSFTERDVTRIYEAQRGLCAWCSASLKGNFHRDHRTALVNGGDNSSLNIQLLCSMCNHKKGSKDELVWANENGKLC